VIISAGIHVIEFPGLVETALGILALEQEAFDFVGGVECVALVLEQASGIALQQTAGVGAVGRAVLVNDLAEDQHLAGAEIIRRRPIECAPVHGQAQIALALRREAADRGTVEGQVVPALHQKLLVVVQHVQPAFDVAEEHRDRFDALFIGQVLESFLLNFVRGNALHALLFGLQVQLFQLPVGKCHEIA